MTNKDAPPNYHIQAMAAETSLEKMMRDLVTAKLDTPLLGNQLHDEISFISRRLQPTITRWPQEVEFCSDPSILSPERTEALLKYYDEEL